MRTQAESLGQQLDRIMTKMDAAYAAWKASGHSDEVRESVVEPVYVELRAFNERAAQAGYGR